MVVTANIDVNNMMTKDPEGKYLVLTTDRGKIWYYGLYSDKESAERAVRWSPEYRFMVEVAE